MMGRDFYTVRCVGKEHRAWRISHARRPHPQVHLTTVWNPPMQFCFSFKPALVQRLWLYDTVKLPWV